MLRDSFERTGNRLFKFRGQIPVVLFILAIFFIWATNYRTYSGQTTFILQLVAVLIAILGFLIRFYTIATTPKGTSGRNTKKQVAESLNVSGIYSIVRHPLYLGNYLIWLGIVWFTLNFYFVLIFSLLFWVYYERIMFAEEMFLYRKFGLSYEKWAQKVPSFFPSFKKFKRSNVPFSYKSILRREYSGILATVIGFVYVDLLIKAFNNELTEFPSLDALVLGITILYVFIVRTLKKKTNLLKEEDRS